MPRKNSIQREELSWHEKQECFEGYFPVMENGILLFVNVNGYITKFELVNYNWILWLEEEEEEEERKQQLTSSIEISFS